MKITNKFININIKKFIDSALIDSGMTRSDDVNNGEWS